MLRRWWLNRFKDDEAFKTTLSILCGGGAALALVVAALQLAWEHWLR